MSSYAGFQAFDIYPHDHDTSANDTEFQLSDYDQLMTGNHTTPVCVFPYDGSRESLVMHLCAGLRNVITQIPLLTGTLQNDAQRRLYILRDPSRPIQLGVQKLDVESAGPSYDDLASQGFPPAFFTAYAAKLTPPDQNLDGLRRDNGCPVAAFQANFIRGGVFIVVALHHCCGDARSIDHIYTLWASSTKAAAEGNPPPGFKPYIDRTYFNAETIIPKDQIESVRSSLRGYVFSEVGVGSKGPKLPEEPSVTIAMYHFSSVACSELKRLCSPPAVANIPYVSSYDCIAGLAWRCMIRAQLPHLKLDPSTVTTRVSHAVDTRARFQGAVPLEYFGNAFNMTATEKLSVSHLVADGSLPEATHAIRRSIQSVHSRYVPNVLNLRKTLAGQEDMQWDFRPENIVITSWALMRPMQAYDFGFGLPDAMRLPIAPYGGVAGVLPGSRNKDGTSEGYDVFVVLETECQERLRADKEWRQYSVAIGE